MRMADASGWLVSAPRRAAFEPAEPGHSNVGIRKDQWTVWGRQRQTLVTSLRSGGGVKRRRDRWAQAVATLPGTCLDVDFAEGWVRICATSSIYWLAVMPPST